MYHSFLIHSSADGHLGFFHVPAIVKSAAWTLGYVCLFVLWFSQGITIGEGTGTPLQDSCLENPMDGGAWVGHDWVTSLSLFTFMHWRRKWHPTPGLLPGKSHGQRSLVGYLSMGKSDGDWSSDVCSSDLLLLSDLHIGFSRGRSGGLVFPSLSEFSTVYCDIQCFTHP